MALDTSDVLDLTKENIQPLRHGRKAAQLKTALQAQIDPETQQQLLKQREQYEFMIRMYEGDDPLNPYYQYVIWLEQSFPKMGRESNLMSVIEDALIKFKDYDKYKQDPRFVKLMIKYISIQSNPLELFQEVYGRGLGTMCSMLYKAWAEELDKHNDFKRANQVFQLGINCRAQPLKELEEAHIQFQLSIARRMLDGNINETAADSGRNVLSKLPSAKVKTNRSSKDSAGVFQSSNPKSSELNKGLNFATPKFKVFEENHESDGIRDFKSKHDKLPKGSIADRENIMKASKWCGQKQKQAFKLPSTPVTPSFPVHEDPDAEYKTKMSVLRPRALKIKREDFNCPVAVFEPPDPTKIPMYPKHLVYVGGRDVQLEEIRAAYYWRKIKKLESEKLIAEPNVEMDISEEPVNLTKSFNSSVDQRPDSFAQNTNQNCVLASSKFLVNAEVPVTKPVPNAAHSFTLEQSALPTFVQPVSRELSSEPQRSFSTSRKSDAFMMRTNIYNRKSEYMDLISQTDLQDNQNPSENVKSREKLASEILQSNFGINEKREKNAVVSHDRFENFGRLNKLEDDLPDFRLSDRNNTSAFHHSPSTSITINTRAAMNVIQKMWESPLASQGHRNQSRDDDFDNVFKMPLPHTPKKVCGTFFRDENKDDIDLKSLAQFNVFADDSLSQCQTKKSNIGLPFQISADKNFENCIPAHSSNVNSQVLPFAVFTEENERENNTKVNELFEKVPVRPKMTSESNPLDDELARPMGTLKMTEAEPRTPLPLIVPVNLQDTPLEPENKENQPPKDYSTPSERRPLSGILTPATDIPVRELNDDDSDDDENNWQIYGRDNEFDESCNTRAFAIRLPSSTPSSRPEFSRAPRRSSLYNGSYISEDVAGPSMTNQASSIAVMSQVACSKNTANLSLILENSKEQGSSSSGNSANVASKNFS